MFPPLNPIKGSFFVSFLFAERIFQVGKYLELRFEFRTSEMQGVILSVAEPVGFPAISIELHKGKVMCRQLFKYISRHKLVV